MLFSRYAGVMTLLWCGTGLAFAQTAPVQQLPNQQSDVIKPGAIAAKPGPATSFTGKVTVLELVRPVSPGRAGVGLVTFQAGARSHWHTHPAGQTLYVTQGCGWTQREGGPVQRICKGDTVYVPPGIRHWHGATDTTSMTHLSVTETLGGHAVDWAEKVSDAQFKGPSE